MALAWIVGLGTAIQEEIYPANRDWGRNFMPIISLSIESLARVELFGVLQVWWFDVV